MAKWYEFPSPLEAEAFGFKEAILWLGELGLSKVQIELDYKLLVEEIVDKTKNQSKLGHVMSNCRSLLSHF